MRTFNLRVLGAAMLLSGCGATDKPIPPVQAQVTPVQRFLPLNAESQKSGVPWSGFFALDSQTGQLCRTTSRQFGNEFDQIPACLSIAQGVKAASSFQKF
jgi:hypothetical protein